MFKSLLYDILIVIGIILIIFSISQVILDGPGQKHIAQQSRTDITEDLYKAPTLRLIESQEKLLNLDYSRIQKPKKEIEITIPGGVSTFEAAEILERSGLIEEDAFLQAVSMFDLETDIKSGNYTFKSQANMIDIFNKILIKRR